MKSRVDQLETIVISCKCLEVGFNKSRYFGIRGADAVV